MTRSIIFILSLLALAACKTPETAVVPDRFGDKDSVIIGDPQNQEANVAMVEDYYSEEHTRYEDYIYRDNIKTVLLHKKGAAVSMPVIELNSDDKIHLSFDDLDGTIKNYKYTLIHCAADWTPTDMPKTDYLNGFTDDFINDYSFSINTIQEYIHYKLDFPNDNMSPRVSGNYVLAVFEDDDPENIVFTKRFMVFESMVTISAKIKRPTIVEDRTWKHELDFSINRANYYISNPYEDLRVVLLQNGRWDNAITDLTPKLIIGDNLDYNYDKENVFEGLNEYRYFDTRNFRKAEPRIAFTKRDSLGNHVFLKPDFKRAFQVYVMDKDINGKFVIDYEDALSDIHTEADYAWVHFKIPYNHILDQGALYLMGSMTDWQFSEEAKMVYNTHIQAYEGKLYLKQGYYNYHYMLLENGQTEATAYLTEGNHYETENTYTILVYHREPGSFYDKLIAAERVSSPGE